MDFTSYDNVLSYNPHCGCYGIGSSSDYALLLEQLSVSASQTVDDILNTEYGPNYIYYAFDGDYHAFTLSSDEVFTIYQASADWNYFMMDKRAEVVNSDTMTDREVLLALGFIEGGIL